MIRRALMLLAIAGIYIAVKRHADMKEKATANHVSDAQWANEGGANAPPSV